MRNIDIGNIYAKFHQGWSARLGGDGEHTVLTYAAIIIV